VLKARAFVLLLGGRTVSMAGNAVAPIALAFAVLRLTGDAGDLGLVLAARTVPQVVFLLYGGVIADRVPPRLILAVAAIVAGLAQAVAAALLLTGVARLWQLGVLEAVNGTAAAMLFPASQSALPRTVPASALQQANALFRLSRNATNVLGAALGGLAVAVFGPSVAIAFDAATFFIAAALWSGMRLVPVRDDGARKPSVVRELAEGWRDVRSRTWLWTIVVQFCFVNAAFSGAFAVLGPLVAEQRLGGAGPWGLVVAAQAAGLTVGSVAMFWLRARRPLLVGNIGMLFGIPLLMLLGAGAPVGLLVAAALLGGLGAELFGVNWDLTMQREIPPERLGRVYSYDAVGSFVFLPVGQALAGPALALFGLSGAIWVAAGIIAAATAAIFTVRDVWILRIPETAAA
jgi:MFS family permease